MPSFRNKDEASRRQAELELMDSTMGMLGVSGAVKKPKSPTATSTLPKGWQPGQQQPGQQQPRPGGGGPRSPGVRSPGYRSPSGPGYPSRQSPGSRAQADPRSPGGPRSPPAVGFNKNGYKPHPRSLSSSNHDNLSSPTSQRSGVSWAPSSSQGSPRSPTSPKSMNLMQQKFGTWDPSSQPRSPNQRTSPQATVGRVAPLTRTKAPETFSPPTPSQKLLLNKPPPGKKQQQTTSKKSVGSYKKLPKDTYDGKPTFVQRHRCLVVCLVIIFLVCFTVAIIVFAIGASGIGGINFLASPKDNVVPVANDNCSYVCENNSTYPRPPLIVIALDGFKYSYLDTFADEMPHLQTIAECGVKAKMLASFPATTSPNLWTIVSGYYPQFHGIVSDWIRDYKTGDEFDPRVNPDGPDTRDAGWFHDEAIWEIARGQGKITASQQWIGDTLGMVEDDHHIGKLVDRSPTYVDEFDRSRNYTKRVEQIVDWLRLPISKRPELITVYFENPGQLGRQHGTESSEVRFVLEEIDGAIGYLRRQLMNDDALGCVNIMIVSTSGMEDTDCGRVYYLTNAINEEEVQNDFIISPSYLGSMSRITPIKHETTDSPVKISTAEESMLNTPAKIIDHLQCSISGGQAYLTDLLPYRLHGAYGHHLEEALVLMDDGWTFAQQRSGHDPDDCRGANDGYDPFSEDMKGVFLGHGRDFKIGESIYPFQNIELFNLITDLIDVTPLYNEPPSDGSKGFLHNALKSPPPLASESWDLHRATNDRCEFPSIRRPDVTECTCTPQELNELADTQGFSFEDIDENLNRNHDDAMHAPFGIPGPKDDINKYGEYYCNLYQENYITSFDRFLHIPTSVSFTLSSNTRSRQLNIHNMCIRYDQRLDADSTPKCSDYTSDLDHYHDIVLNLLYQPSLAPGVNALFDSQITSNIVPQYRQFKEEIWDNVYNELLGWARSSDQVNIVVGPAYDMNRDSQKDSYYRIAESVLWVGDAPLPTHFFVVGTRCRRNGTSDTSLKGCRPEQIQFISYIFAHVREVPSCFNYGKYLRRNLATLRDVEKLTGLVFFPDLSRNEATRLQMVRLKAQYPYNSDWAALK